MFPLTKNVRLQLFSVLTMSCVCVCSWKKGTRGGWSALRTCGCVWGRTTPLGWHVCLWRAAPSGMCCCMVSHLQILPLFLHSKWNCKSAQYSAANRLSCTRPLCMALNIIVHGSTTRCSIQQKNKSKPAVIQELILCQHACSITNHTVG